jgi:heme oxygenase
MIPLKEAIEEKHRLAEKMPFNVRMMKGELSAKEYRSYLWQLSFIFNAIESNKLPHDSLYRTNRINEDINELEGSMRMLSSTMEYINHLYSLTSEEILPHIYLNYLALMFGGQIIKKAIPGSGKIYEFENLPECITSIRRLQKDEWADEANKGLDYTLRILDELQLCTEQN